jgi:hypothetical protein
MKRSGLPTTLTTAMASWYMQKKYLFEPVKEEGSNTLPILL